MYNFRYSIQSYSILGHAFATCHMSACTPVEKLASRTIFESLMVPISGLEKEFFQSPVQDRLLLSFPFKRFSVISRQRRIVQITFKIFHIIRLEFSQVTRRPRRSQIDRSCDVFMIVFVGSTRGWVHPVHGVGPLQYALDRIVHVLVDLYARQKVQVVAIRVIH